MMVRHVIKLSLTAVSLWLAFAASPSAHARDLPAYNPVSEDISEQRRAVYVRVGQRVDEEDLLAIAMQIEAKGKKTFARTYVNFILPGMPVNQGAWASVLFAPDPKVMVHGLSRSDEELFLAEYRADTRSLLGSWLTSPPAAPGRLSIYSDHGKVFAEWRLRGGQKTVDELRDQTSKGVRRFDVPGGGYYVLTRSGDLEIWDKSNLIATAERVRADSVPAPALVASKPAASRLASAQAAPSLLGASGIAGLNTLDVVPPSPVQPEPARPATVKPSPALPQATPAPAAAPAPAPAPQAVRPPATITAEPVEPRTKSKKVARSKVRPKVAVTARSNDLSTGDTISGKIAGRF